MRGMFCQLLDVPTRKDDMDRTLIDPCDQIRANPYLQILAGRCDRTLAGQCDRILAGLCDVVLASVLASVSTHVHNHKNVYGALTGTHSQTLIHTRRSVALSHKPAKILQNDI